MSETITIQVRDFTGCPFAVSAEDGLRLHDAIAPVLKEGNLVVLSFAGIETVIGAFLSAAIGQLYGEFPEERIRELVAVRDLAPEDEAQLAQVGRNARAYYANPAAYDEAWKEVMGDAAE